MRLRSLLHTSRRAGGDGQPGVALQPTFDQLGIEVLERADEGPDASTVFYALPDGEALDWWQPVVVP